MAASNTSTRNLGGNDGMFDIPPEPKKAEQTQRTANSTENASNAGGRGDVNGNPRKPPGQEHSGIVFRYPRSRFQPGQDMIKIDIFEYERSDNQTFNIGSIFANAQSTNAQKYHTCHWRGASYGRASLFDFTSCSCEYRNSFHEDRFRSNRSY